MHVQLYKPIDFVYWAVFYLLIQHYSVLNEFLYTPQSMPQPFSAHGYTHLVIHTQLPDIFYYFSSSTILLHCLN